MKRLLPVLCVLTLLLLGGCTGPFIEAGMFGDEIKAGLEKYKLEQANLQRLKDGELGLEGELEHSIGLNLIFLLN